MIDTVVGLMLFFAIISLLVTSIQEWISSFLKLRGKNLQNGIAQLVGDDFAKDIYSHPLMKTMKEKKTWFCKNPLPSYIKSKYFSQILIDVINPNKKLSNKEIVEIKESINNLPNSELKDILQMFHMKASDNIEKFEDFISEWFDSTMERASGWYKRSIQRWLFLTSFALVVFINADTLTVGKTLWENHQIRNQVASIAKDMSPSESQYNKKRDIIKEVNILFPIGWDNVVWVDDCWKNILNLLKLFTGWLITTFAVSLGAPFWFDLIGKVSNIRKSIKEKYQRYT